MPAPLVTTIVLCYNQAQFVSETLESVRAQTYQNIQLIIIDDYSSDDSVEVIENWILMNGIDCTFIRHSKNEGICKSLNDALFLADGEYISMVAGDDIWLPDKLMHHVEIMEAQPESVGVLYSDAFRIDEHGNLLPQMFIESHRSFSDMPHGNILDVLLEGNFIPGMTTLIRRNCYKTAGLYAEYLPWEDWDMWLRIARDHSFIFSGIPSAKYRIHGQSYTHVFQNEMGKDAWRICLRQFDLGLTPEQKTKIIGVLANSANHFYRTLDIVEVLELMAATLYPKPFPKSLRERLSEISASYWVPALMSSRVPFNKKREIVKLVREIEKRPLRMAMRPALNTVKLKAKSFFA